MYRELFLVRVGSKSKGEDKKKEEMHRERDREGYA